MGAKIAGGVVLCSGPGRQGSTGTGCCWSAGLPLYCNENYAVHRR